MTPEDMTAEEFTRVNAILDEKWRNRICPACDNREWDVAPALFAHREFSRYKALGIGGTSMPFIAAACTNCGYIITFNAIILGLVPLEPQAKALIDAASTSESDEKGRP